MKLLVCDVEGTIFKKAFSLPNLELNSTIWHTLAFLLGEKAIQQEILTHQKWADCEYKNYTEWLLESISIHMENGLTQDIFEKAINSAEYNSGVFDFFNNLDRNIYIPVLISGGFQNLSQRAQIDLKIFHSFTACTYYFRNGILTGYNLLPSDFNGKVGFLKLVLDEYGLTNDDLIFIGDGKNDIEIAKYAKISFGYDPHPSLQEVVHHVVYDFRDISNYL
jgi:phosphoserine phosphatase